MAARDVREPLCGGWEGRRHSWFSGQLLRVFDIHNVRTSKEIAEPEAGVEVENVVLVLALRHQREAGYRD